MRTSRRLLCTFLHLLPLMLFHTAFFSFLPFSSAASLTSLPWRNRFSVKQEQPTTNEKFKIDPRRPHRKTFTACSERNVMNANEHKFLFCFNFFFFFLEKIYNFSFVLHKPSTNKIYYGSMGLTRSLSFSQLVLFLSYFRRKWNL